jgi:hypothetical protein
MASKHCAVASTYDDVWLVDGVRTPFVDYNGALGSASTTWERTSRRLPWQHLVIFRKTGP